MQTNQVCWILCEVTVFCQYKDAAEEDTRLRAATYVLLAEDKEYARTPEAFEDASVKVCLLCLKLRSNVSLCMKT